MHAEAYYFVAQHAPQMPEGAVLEIGSYNVNGSTRPLFPGRAYHGIDVRGGPGVDEVADGAGYDGHAHYGVVVTTETLEHAPDPQAVLASAWRSLRPGGALLLTAAGPERAPHACDGGPVVPPHEHYANISPQQLRDWLADWEHVQVWHAPAAGDVYALAFKPAE